MRLELARALAALDCIESLTVDEAQSFIERLREKTPKSYLIGNSLAVECSSVEITVKEEHRDLKPGMFLVSTDLSIKIDDEEWGGKLTAATLRIHPIDAVMLTMERIV